MKKVKNILGVLIAAITPLLMWRAFQSPSLRVSESQALRTSASAPKRTFREPVGEVREKLWKEFRQVYGVELEPVFSPNGKLVSIRSNHSRAAVPAREEFDPKSEASVRARAMDFAQRAAGLLGVPISKWGQIESIRTGAASAQVFFVQQEEGLPIEPKAVVTVDFSRNGSLNAVYSSLIPNVEVHNRQDVSKSAADDTARSLAADRAGLIGGRLVVFVPRPDVMADRNLGYRAYDYTVSGQQVIIDAQSGKVIFRRPRATPARFTQSEHL